MIWQAIARKPLSRTSLIVISSFVVASVLAPWIAPYPSAVTGDPHLDVKFKPPSDQFLMGTDYLGRDILSRILFGIRISLIAGLAVVVLAVVVGLPLGLVAGYYRGRLEEVMMGIADLFLAFPSLLLAILIAFLLGPSLVNSMIAVAITWWPWYTRLGYAGAKMLREQPLVEASKALGLSDGRILTRHVLPNIAPPIIIQATIDLGTAILVTAGLGFLGLGAQPPTPELGQMTSDGRAYLFSAWWYPFFPGFTIFLMALAFNLLGDGLREALDPRLRRVVSRARLF